MLPHPDSFKLIAIYDPVEHCCKVIRNGSLSCYLTPSRELFRGTYEEVDKWIGGW